MRRRAPGAAGPNNRRSGGGVPRPVRAVRAAPGDISGPPIVLRFSIMDEAQPAGSKTAGVASNGRRYYRDDNPAAGPWKELVRRRATEAMCGRAPSAAAAFTLSATFYFPRPLSHYRTRNGRPTDQLKRNAPHWKRSRPDLDKIIRAIKDGLAGAVYVNDSQVVHHGSMAKLYGDPPRVEIRVQQIRE